MELTEHHHNILNVWEQATPEDIKEGEEWYPSANEFATKLSQDYHTDFNKVCGVLSALSPQNRWDRNKRDAEQLIALHEADFNNVYYGAFGGTGFYAMRQPTDRAIDILNTKGDVLDYFKSLKTRNFYLNIKDPSDTSNLTIDSHSANIWANKLQGRLELDYMFKNSKNRYVNIQNDYRYVAEYLNVNPIHLQVITWLTWRKLLNINETYS